MLTQVTVESALLKWMEEFVEKPHPGLGGWPPCPFARQARLSKNIDIRQGSDPFNDCVSLLEYDWSKEVGNLGSLRRGQTIAETQSRRFRLGDDRTAP